MATPKVLLKRSSVVGRIPDSSDLQYGELAINFADGKLYYKDDSNNIKAFIDSARVQAIANAVEATAESQLDSSEVTSLIDSAYVQARVPLSYLEGLIDSAYIQARQIDQDFAYSSLTGTPNILDSANVTSIVDSAYIQARQVDIFRDSGFISAIIDSAHIQARQLDSAANATLSLVSQNSTKLNNQVASYYLNYNNLSNKPTILDTVDVSNIITTDVNKAFVDALNVDADTLDGYQAQYFIDKIDSNTAAMLDSAEAIALIDSAYVQARQSTYTDFDTDFAAKTTTDLTEGDNLYYTKARADSDIATSLNDSTNTVNITINNTIEDKVDSAYVLARIDEAPFIDSAEAINLIDSAYVRARVRTNQDLRTTDDVTFGKITGDSAALGQVSFSTTWNDSHIPFEEGAVWYDPHHKNLNYYTDFDHPIELGMQIIERVYNNNAYTILKGQPLYYSGNRTDEAGQESPTVGLANATESTKYNVQGLAAEDIPQNSYGQIVVAGVIDGFNTSGLNAGENFFAGLTDGAVQNAAPTYPNYPMCLGWVIVSDSSDGKVIINQQNHSVNTFRVQGDTHIGDDLVVDGNLTVNGTQTVTSTANVQIGGNIQYLNGGDTIGEGGTTFVGSGLDDAFFSGHYSGDSSTKSFFVKIDATGGTDTFEWGFDSSVGTEATGIAITGAAQTLDSDYGIEITFGATTGHTTGDKWTGTATATDIDTGIFTNRNTGDGGDGYTHLGLYYDVSQNEWTFVSEYEPEPENPINRSDPSFTYGDVRGKNFYGTTFNGNLTGNVTGTVSDISNHATTDLTEGDNLYYTTARHDSDTLAQVDAAYVQARQTVYTTANFTDSAFVTGLPVSTFTNDANYLDSTTVQGVIDATYIQANQTTYSNVSEFTNDANYLDSTTVQGVINSAYIQSNQITYNTSDFTDSSYVTGLPISTFTNDANYLDSTTATQLVDSAYINARVATGTDSATVSTIIQNDVDSAYVQARQDFAYGSLTGTPTIPTLGTDFVDSGQVEAIVDSAYIELRRPAETIFSVAGNGAVYTFTGDGFSSAANNPTLYLTRGKTYKFGDISGSHPLEIRVSNGGAAYSDGVTNNGGSGTVLFTVNMDAPNNLVYQCTIHSGMVGDIVIVDDALILDSARVSSIITADVDAAFINALTIDADTLGGQNSAYHLNYNNFTNTPTTVDSAEVIKLITANAIDSGVALQLLLDSSEVVNLIDSAYVQARQSGGEITIQEEGSSLSTAATTLNFVGSAVTASGTGTTKTITISQAEGGTDSATVVTIIGDTVDSAYVAARTTTGTDSAAIIQLIDSDYVQARQTTGSSDTNGSYTQTFFRFQADSGQTVFTGADLFNQTLDYVSGHIDVFLNGILLVDSVDYTQTNSSTLTSTDALDSGDEISIIYRRGLAVTPNVTTYEYTASGSQATFSGTALNGKSLAYSAGAVHVFVNGILLKSSEDYTATNGTSVVLTTSADSGDDIAIAAYAAPHAKATTFTFTADSGQSIFSGNDDKENTLSYDVNNNLVFLNGIILNDSSDFTAENGTSITLTTAANLNDEFKVVTFGSVTTTQSNNNWDEIVGTNQTVLISTNEKKIVDVSDSAVTLSIQDSGNLVSMGDELRIIDGYGNAATNNITVTSTKKILGSDSDLIIDINRSGVNLVYYNESNGWVLIEN